MFKLYVAIFLLLCSPALLSAQSTQTKKNAGKIVFATQPFNSGSVSTSKSFTSSDFIYGQLVCSDDKKFNEFLTLPGNNKDSTYANWNLHYNLDIYQNGNRIDMESVEWDLLNVNWNTSTLNLDVLPAPKNATTGIAPPVSSRTNDPFPPPFIDKLKKGFSFSENGKYKIHVTVYDKTLDARGYLNPEKEWPRFEGEFDFTYNINDRDKIENTYWAVNDTLKMLYAKIRNQQELIKIADKAKAKAQADNAKVENMRMPESWTAKSQPIGGGFTVDQIKKFFLNETKGKSIVKVVADVNGGWIVQKDKYGIPTHQYLNQPVVVFFKNTNGQCGLHHISIAQSYIGKGKYNKPGLDLYDEELLPCSKMK